MRRWIIRMVLRSEDRQLDRAHADGETRHPLADGSEVASAYFRRNPGRWS